MTKLHQTDQVAAFGRGGNSLVYREWIFKKSSSELGRGTIGVKKSYLSGTFGRTKGSQNTSRFFARKSSNTSKMRRPDYSQPDNLTSACVYL